MKRFIALFLIFIFAGCKDFSMNDKRFQTKVFNNGKTNLTIDGNLDVSGELNKGRFAQLDSVASSVSQILSTGFSGDQHARGTWYQQLGQHWQGPIANPFLGANILSIAYGNGIYVAAGNVGQIARSTDLGITWGALIANPFGGTIIWSIAYGNGVFVAVGAGGKIARSTDNGATWGALIVNPFLGADIFSIAYGNGVFVAVGDTGQIVRSTDDGLTWGALIANPFGITVIRSVTFGNGVFVAVGNLDKIARSINLGLTWGVLLVSPFGTDIYDVTYGNAVFVACSLLGGIARSIDYGATWGALIVNPCALSILYSVSYNSGIFQVGGTVGTGVTARSYDNGLTWGNLVLNPFGINAIRRIASSPTNFCAVGDGGSIATAGWRPVYSLVEPVTTEPSLGTPHSHHWQFWAAAAGAAGAYIVSCAGRVPIGTKRVFVSVRAYMTAVNGYIAIGMGVWTYFESALSPVGGGWVACQGYVDLNAALEFGITIFTSAFNGGYGLLSYYDV